MKTTRRNLFRLSLATGLAAPVTLRAASTLGSSGAAASSSMTTGSRHYWLQTLDKLSRPVLSNLAQGTLKARMPVEQIPGKGREKVTHLEAFGRLLFGIAPWLELTEVQGAEKSLQRSYLDLAHAAIERATNPLSPDFMNFNGERQPMVDAAMVAQAFLRAPKSLWLPLTPAVKAHVIDALESTRKLANPIRNNWVMFAATIECFLMTVGRPTDPKRFQHNIQVMLNWYVGDGTYGDGKSFHADYYNAFVIQPMLVDCLNCLRQHDRRYEDVYQKVLTRSIRYAAIQERMIGPDGTFPPLGRSIAYRAGAFQTLAQMALLNHLPKKVSPAQVREALGAVLGRTLGPAGTFDAAGWLRIGLAGHQPLLAEDYVSTGSLYITSAGLLPLGLPASHEFWSAPAAPWTAQKIWAGVDMSKDAALRDDHELQLPPLL